jgi:predicted rRNA methylase YqxC with S4 and FtsJ domains
MLWLRPEIAAGHPYAIDKMLVSTGLAESLTEARRLIAAGAIYLNNKKLTPPVEGFLPVAIVSSHEYVNLVEYVALGIR